MYNRGRDSMEFFMFINSTVHMQGWFQSIKKEWCGHYRYYKFTENSSRMMETFAEKVCTSPPGWPLNLSMGP